MSKKTLLASCDIPGYGCGAGSGYRLFEKMQADGADAAYVNLVESQDVDFFKFVFGEEFGNPKSLERVTNIIVDGPGIASGPGFRPPTDHAAPAIMVAIGFGAAAWLKRVAPENPLVFIPTTCPKIVNGAARRRPFFVREGRQNPAAVGSSAEKEAAAVSDLIVAPSRVIQHSFRISYPSVAHKIYEDVIWDAEWRCEGVPACSELNRDFSKRDIDVLFVTTSWENPEKNYRLVKNLISRLKGVNAHVIGEVPEKIRGVSHHGLVTDAKEYYGLLGRTKTVVCPAAFDPLPEALAEASLMGCNIVAAKTSGYAAVCNENLLAGNTELEPFAAKVSLSLRKYFEPRIEEVMGCRSYERLLDIIFSLGAR
jgi:glycosyltransferase involved in cell wall biosynthesis